MESVALLDSGVWVACFLEEDLFHSKADQLIRRLLSTPTTILVPEVLRAEIFMDFLVASYALYWEVEAFYSFDEKLNQALRRIKPEIVKLKIRRGRIVEV